MNGQPGSSEGRRDGEPRRLTRAQQRAATRLTLMDAAAECLIADGYAGLTTRKVADRAGVAQSTVMHHFPTRDAFLTETVTHLAMRLADDALERVDLADLRQPARRDVVLDQAWTQFTSPEALAVLQLWIAAWTEPDLAAALRDLEARLGSILVATAATLFPDQADDPRFPALIDTAISLIRGLVVGIPISGLAAVDARWAAIKPILLEAAADLLDAPSPTTDRPRETAHPRT